MWGREVRFYTIMLRTPFIVWWNRFKMVWDKACLRGGDFFLAPITLSQEFQNQIQGLTPLQQQKVLDFV